MGPSPTPRKTIYHIVDRVRRLCCVTANWGGECPLWVKSGHHKGSAKCPLYPQKRTAKFTDLAAVDVKQAFVVVQHDLHKSFTASVPFLIASDVARGITVAQLPCTDRLTLKVPFG